MIRQGQAKTGTQTSLLPHLCTGANSISVVLKYHFRSTLWSNTLQKSASFPHAGGGFKVSVQISLIPTRAPHQQVREGQPSSSSSPEAEGAGEAGGTQPPSCPPQGTEHQTPCPALPAEAPQLWLPQKIPMQSSLPAISQRLCPPRARSGISAPPWQRRWLWARLSAYLRGPAPGSQALF